MFAGAGSEGSAVTSIRCLVNESADISRHEPAIILPGRRIIYSEYEQYVAATAARLRHAGVAGSRVGIRMADSWQVAVLVMALLRVKSVACMLDPRRPLGAALDAAERLGCGRLLAEPPWDEATPRDRLLNPADVVAFFSDDPGDGERVMLGLEQPASILVAEGGASNGRGILHSFGSHYYSARGANHNVRVPARSRWLLTSSFREMAGFALLFRCAQSGAALVIPGAGERLEDVLERYEITHLSLDEAALGALVKQGLDGRKLRRVQAILMPTRRRAPIVAEAVAAGLPVFPSYCVEEMASQVTAANSATPLRERSTLGAPLRHCEVGIAADGEVLVRGRPLFEGYADSAGLDPARDAEGWFATGDLGALDASGYLTVSGRKDGR
jgi:O-succinylbenzoic acid--CoA ligase